jgi:NDP-sugar pyrophosphorylase family protein
MKTAMLLCAGYGTRLKELTKDIPKPMLPVDGKPMIEHTIRHLSKLGIKDIVINVSYLADKITSYFGNGENWGVHIHYSHEKEPLGTAGAVKNAAKLLEKNAEFLVLYGDVISFEDYNKLFEFHRSKKDAIASIILHERKSSNSVVEMDRNNKIIKFVERPTAPVADKNQDWVNSGLYCFDNKILELIPEKGYCDLPKDVFPTLVSNGTIYGYPLTGYRCAVDSPERYEELQDEIKKREH